MNQRVGERKEKKEKKKRREGQGGEKMEGEGIRMGYNTCNRIIGYSGLSRCDQ